MSFSDEMRKIAAGRDVGQLLSNLAARTGVRPSLVPGIRQVQNVAKVDRSRAAEIAQNIRGALKNKQLKAA